VYYLNLNEASFSTPERNVFFEAVVDGRPGQPPIGTVYQGPNNRTAAVLFRQGLVPEFSNWLQSNLPRRATDRPVVLCLRQLRISEEMSGLVELARADLAADIYEYRADGYHFLCSVADHVNEKALETAFLHASHPARLMRSCLGQIASAEKTVRAPTPSLALAQLAGQAPQRASAAPILRQARPQRIWLNDHEVGQLRPGQFIELMWPYFGYPARLVVDMPGNPAILLAPSTTEATYIRLQQSAARTPWQVLPSREGEAAVDVLERPRR
jgi:hypothetical protein